MAKSVGTMTTPIHQNGAKWVVDGRMYSLGMEVKDYPLIYHENLADENNKHIQKAAER